MRVVMFGANGGLGRQLVLRALATGHEVTAFIRQGGGSVPQGVRTVIGDVLDAEGVAGAVAGQEAVLDAIGVRTHFAVRAILEGLRQEAGDALRELHR